MTSNTALPVELLPFGPEAVAARLRSFAEINDSMGRVVHGQTELMRQVADFLDAWDTRALSATRTETPTHRHKKRGSEYVLIGIGKMQADWWTDGLNGKGSADMAEVAIYRDVKDGSLWARPREEFEDGRFENLSTTEGE